MQNPPNQSYTKKELRLLLKKPDVDLNRPVGVEPVSDKVLRQRAKSILKRLGDAAGFTLEQWKEWRQVPAHVCELILSPGFSVTNKPNI